MNIVVIAGGISTEREVSINTGYMVCKALKNKGHNVSLIDVYFGEKIDKPYTYFNKSHNLDEQVEYIKGMTKIMEETKKARKTFFGENLIDICLEADIVFMALHGESGENGKVQAAFDLFGIRYTGSEYLGSALAMDKGLAKNLFYLNDIPAPRGISINKMNNDDTVEIPFPCVVKPCCGGSSVGVSIVKTMDEYNKALEAAFKYENEILVESYIMGREFSVGVIGDTVLPIIEIAPKSGFYDYEHKYIAGMTEEICPADLEESIGSRMQEIAKRVGEVLRLKVYYRADFLLDENNNIYCLEANTLPGMTATSLLPQEALAIGMTFEDLCEKIIELSIKRYEEV